MHCSQIYDFIYCKSGDLLNSSRAQHVISFKMPKDLTLKLILGLRDTKVHRTVNILRVYHVDCSIGKGRLY